MNKYELSLQLGTIMYWARKKCKLHSDKFHITGLTYVLYYSPPPVAPSSSLLLLSLLRLVTVMRFLCYGLTAQLQAHMAVNIYNT